MDINQLLEKLAHSPDQVEFDEVIEAIVEHYDYQPVKFTNGDAVNAAGTNEGSCKIFAFAQLHQLTATQTLACFGRYYREDVLQHPQGTDHANIRNFIQAGWAGIVFSDAALWLRK